MVHFEDHMARQLDTHTSGFGLSPLCSERPFWGAKRMFQALFASNQLQCSQNSNQHALNLIKCDVIASPVIELGGAGAGMVRHGGGTL